MDIKDSNTTTPINQRSVVLLWLGTMASYLTTSAIMVMNHTEIPQIIIGRDFLSQYIFIMYSIIPVMPLIFGWLLLFSFTVTVFDICVLPIYPGASEYILHRVQLVRSRFRIIVLLLVLSWSFSLIVPALLSSIFTR